MHTDQIVGKIALARLLAVTALLAASGCTGSSHGAPQSAPSTEGDVVQRLSSDLTRPAGAPIRHGLRVPAGTHLIGTLFPSATRVPHAAAGWTANLLVTGDPVAAAQDWLRQLHSKGYVGSHSRTRPWLCTLISRETGSVSLTEHTQIPAAFTPDNSTIACSAQAWQPRQHVGTYFELEAGDGVAQAQIGIIDDEPAPLLGRGPLPRAARSLPFDLPAPAWSLPEDDGDEIAAGFGPYRLTLLPRTELAAPALPSDATPLSPRGFLAVFRVDGDPVPVMRAYARQLGRSSGPAERSGDLGSTRSVVIDGRHVTYGTDDPLSDTSIDGIAITSPDGNWVRIALNGG